MGKYSGYLICTDYDGTFAFKGEPVQENLDAVRYFTENGGRFTVATGRTVGFIRQRGMQDVINALACLYNGSVLYDYAQDKPVYERCLKLTTAVLLQAVQEKLHLVQGIYVFSGEKTGNPFYENLSDISREHMECCPLKLLCKFDDAQKADEFKHFAMDCPELKNTHISKSWAVGVEFNDPSATKGAAIDFLKSYYPDVHTTIGVGDYENDITLLTHADIAAAPENAIESVRDAATVHLKPCAEGAIADLIQRL